ncbi:MAG: hypothetical protein KDC98_12410 [Planctomycetes bacterium]|nr:hypothetical protein [Planctomycetota bacterium]
MSAGRFGIAEIGDGSRIRPTIRSHAPHRRAASTRDSDMADRAQQLFTYTIDDPDAGRQRVHASFLPQDVVFARGLPPAAIIGQVMGDARELDPARFTVNRAFVDFLHACIAKHAARCPALVSEAARQGQGHVFLIDARTPDPAGEVPPHDILGAVAVEGGIIEDYQPNPNHRILTVDGVVTLDPWMFDRLQAELRRLVESA